MTGGFENFARGFGRRPGATAPPSPPAAPTIIYLTPVVPVEGRDGAEHGYALALAPIPGLGVRVCGVRHLPDGRVEVTQVEP